MAVIDLFIKELERGKECYGEICITFHARDGKKKVETRRRYFRQAGKRIGARIYTAQIYNKIVIANRKPKKPKKDDMVSGCLTLLPLAKERRRLLMRNMGTALRNSYPSLRMRM